MYSILIVDDERIAIEGLLKGIRWEKLGIDRVYSASSAPQARKLFRENEVDLLLCDIDMPQENGIDLLKWVKQECPQTVALFFTCYAEFEYAKQAIALGAFDYLLKPAKYQEIEQALLRGIKQIEESRESRTVYRYGKLWVENQESLEEQLLWRNLLTGVWKRREEMEEQAQSLDMELSADERYLAMLYEIKSSEEQLSVWSQKDLDYACRNILYELFLTPGLRVRTVSFDKSMRAAVLLGEGTLCTKEVLKERGRLFIEAFAKHFQFQMSLACGAACRLEQLPAQYTGLTALLRQEVVNRGDVLFLDEPKGERDAAIPTALEKWREYLSDENFSGLYEDLEKTLRRAERDRLLTSKSLKKFYHALMQLVYSEFERRNLLAERLFSEDGEEQDIFQSLESFLQYIGRVLEKAENSLQFSGHAGKIVDRVNRYINGHLSQELTRDEIAEYVFLNPSYLSRLYSQETGKSLTEYILETRMQAVKNLLEQTTLSVSEIAYRTGYTNLPYLSRLFRKQTGMTPLEYRKSKQKNNGI